MTTTTQLLTLVLLALPLAPLQDEESPSVLPEAPEYRVRYYMLDGDPDMERLNDALEDLHEEAEIIQGPDSSRAAPNDNFIALRTPLEISDRDAERAVKKGRAKPVPLVWTHARWSMTEMPDIPRGGGGDWLRSTVLGSHSDLHWCELRGQEQIFYYEPGDIDGEWLAERIVSGFGPFVGEDFEVEVVQERIVWELAEEPEARDIRSVERDLERTDGVSNVGVYEQPWRVEFTLALDGLEYSGPPKSFGGGMDALEQEQEPDPDPGQDPDADQDPAPRRTSSARCPTLDPSALLEVLTDNDLVVLVSEDEQ